MSQLYGFIILYAVVMFGGCIMKFEKLSENKIKITLTSQDLKDKNIDFHSFMSNTLEKQDLFWDIL